MEEDMPHHRDGEPAGLCHASCVGHARWRPVVPPAAACNVFFLFIYLFVVYYLSIYLLFIYYYLFRGGGGGGGGGSGMRVPRVSLDRWSYVHARHVSCRKQRRTSKWKRVDIPILINKHRRVQAENAALQQAIEQRLSAQTRYRELLHRKEVLLLRLRRTRELITKQSSSLDKGAL